MTTSLLAVLSGALLLAPVAAQDASPPAGPENEATIAPPPGDDAVPDASGAADPSSSAPDTSGAVEAAPAARSGAYYGLWRWVEEPSLDNAVLHAYASSRRADSLYVERDLTLVTVSDTTRYSFFTPPRWMFRGLQEPSREEEEFDVATGIVSRSRYVGERRFGVPTTFTPDAYARSVGRTTYRREWVETGTRLLAIADDGSGGTGGIRIDLPAMPSFARGIFGDGNSTLSVSGSERISFSGTSRWFPFRPDNGLTSQSKFPELDMKQDLFLKLSGTIGDKVHVDVDQNSNAETSLENNIRIRYEGYEDDVIRRVNLGNTSLSLPGTRYVSYGGRHEGLFGISAEAQVGPIKVTSIASKQESEATTQSVPSRNASSTPIPELSARDYIRRRYYFLDDPNRIRDIQVLDTDGTTVLAQGPGLVPLNIDASSIRIYKDDDRGSNNTEQGAVEAYATPSGYPPCACGVPAPCDTAYASVDDYPTFFFEELVPDIDYRIHVDRQSFEFRGLVVELLGPQLGDNETLAAAFRTNPQAPPLTGDLDGDGAVPDSVGSLNDQHLICNEIRTFKMISPPLEELRQDDLTVGPWAPVHALEIKNFYRLGGRNVQELDFEIFWDRTGGTTNPTNFRNEPYIEITGLDVERPEGTTPVPGQDGEVDGRYLDRDQGIIHFPQLRPFAPDSFDVNYRRSPLGVLGEVQEAWPENVVLTGATPDSGNYPEREIYDSRATVFRLASDTHVDRFKMRGSFESPINVIELNRFNIIEGSETVTAGSRTLTRGTHYDIDYEFGTVTIRESANVGPDEEVNVTFAYAPLFGTASRTLAGFSSSLRPDGGTYGISTTWMFESKGNPERRVKLGEEPTRTIIGELSGDYKSESTLLTDVLDKLPFYTPATRSQITASGALGVSLPNPNTKGEAYIDDFDAARDSRDLSLNRRSWHYPAIPLLLQQQGFTPEQAAQRRGNMVWYSPRRAALREDLNPELSSQEGDDQQTVLEWWLRPNAETTDGQLLNPEDNWYGLTQAISTNGEDLSTAQFLDIWINDFRDPDVRDTGVMYIDIGQVSEDAVWWKTGPDGYTPPQGVGFNVYDTEDVSGEGRLDECDRSDPNCNNEDTGLDTLFDGTGDPNGDDWSFPDSREDEEDDPVENLGVFEFVNGTEGNASLDTEDLNGDQDLDDNDNYFTYRFELASQDSNLIVTDVQEDFGNEFPIDADNGWRRIRIPLGEDFEFDRVGIPDLTLVKHVRLWFTGVRAEKPIQIAGVEFVGNKWLTGAPEAPILNASGQPADESELALGQKFAVSVVNNKDNGDIYEPAFQLQQDRDQAGDEFEGYLSLDLLNFPAGHSGTAYRRFPQDQDYTFYETFEFYTQLGLPASGALGLDFFIRFGSSDGTNYYEYRKPVRTGAWDLIEVPIKDLSGLKQNLPSGQQFIKQPYADGATISMKGRPSFSRVRQITIGVTNSSGGFLSRASVWVNELRLDDVQRNVSTAGQLNVAATLSDLATFSFGIEGRDADFVQIGQSRGTGITDRRLRWDTSVNVDRFVPRLNLRVPVRYSYSRTTQEPKFQTGSDIVFEGANRELNVSQSITRNFSTEYSRTPSQNPFLRYTIDAFRAGYSRDERKSVRPAAADSTVSWRASLNYNISAPYHPLIRLPLGMELDYMPSSFSASGQNTESETRTWQRSSSDLTEPLEFQNATDSRSRTLSWSTSYRPLVNPNVNYQFQSTRDLLRSGPEPLGVNLGLETNRSESLAAGYAINAIPDATATAYPVIGPALATVVNKFLDPLNPSVNWSGRSSSSVDVSRLASGVRPRSIQNSTSTTLRGRLPVSGIMRALRNAARTQVSSDDDEDDDEEGSSGGRQGRGKGTRRNREEPETGRDEDDRRGGGGERGRGGQEPEAEASSSPLGVSITVGDVTAQYTRTRSSNHSLVAGDPSLKYRLGFTRELNPEIRRLASNNSSRSDSDVYTFSSTGKLSNLRFGDRRIRTTLDVKASFTDENSGRVSTSLGSDLTLSPPTLSLNERRTWPDLQFTATGVEDALPFLAGRFRRVTLTSRFTQSEDVTGDQIVPRRRVTNSTDWAPFLSIETTMKSGLRVTARRNTRSSDVRASGVAETVSKLSSSDLTFSVQHTLERKRSVDLPFGQGKRIITTRIDIALNVSRRTQKNATVDANTGRETVLTDTRDFNASAELGYNFTKNIHGTARVNYGERKDLKTLSNTSRTLGITLTATFQF